MRYRSLWLAAGWLLVTVVIFLSLTPSPPSLGVAHGDKLGHLTAYAVLMAWFSELYAGRVRLMYGIGFILLGVMLEFVQEWTGARSFEFLDMLAGGLGVLLAGLIYLPVRRGALPRVERYMGLV